MLEITEGVIMNERSVAIETMNALRKLGVGLSLDDFGIGYSSLSRLAHLPIRELKIDRSFMRDIESDPSALAIVTAVVRVGQSLHLTVVAEGVETEGQRQLLTELGCDVIQGYLYARALSPAAFGRWLLDHSAARAHDAAQRRRGGRSATDAVAADGVDGRIVSGATPPAPTNEIVYFTFPAATGRSEARPRQPSGNRRTNSRAGQD